MTVSMPPDLKKGDYVRVTCEGTITMVHPRSKTFRAGFNVGSLCFLESDDTQANVTVERVTKPLPTTPGSVLRDTVGVTIMLCHDGTWLDSDNDVRHPTLGDDVTILYDAGAK